MVKSEAINSAVFLDVKNWPYFFLSFLGIDSTKDDVTLYAIFRALLAAIIFFICGKGTNNF